MNTLVIVITILLILIIFRKPIKEFFNKSERLTNSISNKVDIFCMEMDTETLNTYNRLKDNGKIDPKASEQLAMLLEQDKRK